MAESAAIALASLLRPVFGRRVLGPEPAVVDKVMGEHIMLLMLKVERGKSFAEARRLLLPHIETIKKHKDFKNITLICNVDPQ